MDYLDYDWLIFLFRWFHVLGGVMWIGILWYFNFIQIPTMPKIPEEQRPAVTGHIAPEALFWFRWAALSTVVTGLILAQMNGYLVDALAIGLTDGSGRSAAIGHRHVVRPHHGLQCMVHHLAQAADCARSGRG